MAIIYPEKYTNLLKIQEAGVVTPAACLVTEEQITHTQYGDIDIFLSHYSENDTFIVRSATTNEDSGKYANAGFFYSSGEVKKSNLISEIEKTYKENRKRADTFSKKTAVHLIISPYIHAKAGGVAFTPWLYFFGHTLVSYGASPQQVVTGNAGTYALISHDLAQFPEHNDVTQPWQTKLSTEITKLQKLFVDPIDIEWIYDGDCVYILQVRPITIAPTATKTKTKQSYVTADHIGIDVFGESIGKLSPLSFALLSYLYEHAQQYWEHIEIQGGPSFLIRAINGALLTDKVQYRSYMQDRRWYSAFKRQLSATSAKNHLKSEAENWEKTEVFDIKKTTIAFSNWQTAEAFEQLKGQHTAPAFPFEYELMNAKIYFYGSESLAAVWKGHFMESLQPLKETVKKNPKLVWQSLESIFTNEIMHDEWDQTYLKELPESLYEIVDAEAAQSDEKFISGNLIQGTVSYIKNPVAWSQSLPKGKIIVTPYIPQSWIMELPYIRGIITTRLTELSHAAIVLRENEVPAKRVSREYFDSIRDGQEVDLKK